MVIRLCVRLSVLLLSVLLLTACPSKEGAVVEENVASFTQEPAPLDPPVYKTIDIPYFGFLRETNTQLDSQGEPLPATQQYLDRTDATYDGALSLLSFDPVLAVDEPLNYAAGNPDQISIADTGLIVALNTSDSAEREIDVTVFSRDDTIFTVNHSSGEIRGLKHFATTVCEIIPADTVVTEVDGGDVELRVINAPWVYIKTADGSCNGTDTNYSNASIQYYRLPLNFQLNVDKFELCEGEVVGDIVGTNTDPDTCKTRQLDIVLESEARAEILFGWLEDEETAAPNDYRLAYRFLGYGAAEKKLKLFDENRVLLWEQDREVERFNLLNDSDTPTYYARLHPLNNYNYLYQFGREIFVFNSTQDLFSKDYTETETVLVDRNYQLDAEILSTQEHRGIVNQANIEFNDTELLIFDQAKILNFDYSSNDFTPDPLDQTSTYEAVYLNDLLERANFEATPVFSQFDIQDCEDEGQADGALTQAEIDALVDACINAHDVNDSQLPDPGEPWQFITSCDASLGCEEVIDNTDYCVTDAELLIDPSLADLNNPCSPADYQHFNELDEPANDVELIGYMQYATDHVRGLETTLVDQTLFILARMKERDLLVRYLYQVSLAAPKTAREQVMLGTRFEHQGLTADFLDGNLYASVLRKSATRSNECYKDYQRVSCDLVDTVNGGNNSVCTGLDVISGACFSQFDEYVSYPLYCSQSQIDAGACTEECTAQQIIDGDCDPGCSAADIASGACPASLVPVYHLLANPVEAPFGKWLSVNDYSSDPEGETELMVLAVDSADQVSDEGVIQDPMLLAFDTTNDATTLKTILSGQVEHVISGRIESDEIAWIDLVSRDVVQIGSASTTVVSEGLQIFLADPLSVSPEATTVSEYQYLRPETE